MRQVFVLAPEPLLTTCYCPGACKDSRATPSSPLHSVLYVFFPSGLCVALLPLSWEKYVHSPQWTLVECSL